VFLTGDRSFAPAALTQGLNRYKVLPEKNVILTIETAHTPRIDPRAAAAHRAGGRYRRTGGAAVGGDAQGVAGLGQCVPKLIPGLTRGANDATSYFQIPTRPGGGGGHAGDHLTASV
jgi:hypothetical protein